MIFRRAITGSKQRSISLDLHIKLSNFAPKQVHQVTRSAAVDQFT